MNLISRSAAKAQGLSRYFTGTPCKNGGVAERYVAGSRCLCAVCSDRAKATTSAWNKKNYAENTAEMLARNDRYYEKNREAILAQKKEYFARMSDSIRKKRKAFYQRHKSRIDAEHLKYRLANYERYLEYHAEYRVENRQRRAELLREYYRRNYKRDLHKLYARMEKRRAAKMKRTPPWFGELDLFVFEEAFDLAAHRRDATGLMHEVDHMLPLQGKAVSGLHVASNIQVLPAFLNRMKRNSVTLTEPDEWLSKLA